MFTRTRGSTGRDWPDICRPQSGGSTYQGTYRIYFVLSDDERVLISLKPVLYEDSILPINREQWNKGYYKRSSTHWWNKKLPRWCKLIRWFVSIFPVNLLIFQLLIMNNVRDFDILNRKILHSLRKQPFSTTSWNLHV